MAADANQRVADRLREAASLLEQQDANRFRVAAYRRAADTVAGHDRDVRDVLSEDGFDGLMAIPDVGRGIAGAIREMLTRGSWGLLERLRGQSDPEELFSSVPSIGPVLARRISDGLDLDTLEGLEQAAHDGRLEEVQGIGSSRAAAVRASLAVMLQRSGTSREATSDQDDPPVRTILDVDREYRRRAEAGELPTIAPRRFNPEGESWLPILHTQRDSWQFTALYSNTARAHELGATRDWVVVYHSRDDEEEGQHTVVTEHRGRLAGARVVRGREAECRRHHGRDDG